MRFTGIIPARYNSTRFPGKPLVLINGKPMIQHVYQRALKWKNFDYLLIATPDPIIANECGKLAIPYVLTEESPNDCIDCAAMAADILDDKVDRYIIIQGDEPTFDYSILDKIDYSRPIINLYTDIAIDKTFKVDIVKVIIQDLHEAVYFSRASIPHCDNFTTRNKNRTKVYHKQLGLYAFSGKALKMFHLLKPSYLEEIEGIGLNRLIENRIPIHMQYTSKDSISVDIPEDIKIVENILKGKSCEIS